MPFDSLVRRDRCRLGLEMLSTLDPWPHGDVVIGAIFSSVVSETRMINECHENAMQCSHNSRIILTYEAVKKE